MLEISQYQELQTRPNRKAAQFQSWHDLTFLHIRVDPAELQAHIPESLTVDTYPDESGREWAYLGLVPFWMSGIRFPWSPAVPWLSSFPETNVRTYVHHHGEVPGVYFFSLDASRWIACQIARKFFSLPYFHARMKVTRKGSTIHYQHDRWRSARGERTSITCEPKGSLNTAAPGTLEFFLIERYVLYCERGDELFWGQVHHSPYQIQRTEVNVIEQTLFDQLGIAATKWIDAYYSPRADVEVFAIQPMK